MSDTHDIGRIEIDEDKKFLAREWTIQRIGWVVIGLVVLAAFTGAFGRGPLSKASAGDPATFGVDYSRIIRHGADDEMTIHVGPGSPGDTSVTIAVSRAYLEKNEVRTVTPEPASQQADGDVYVFSFSRREAGRPIRIALKLHAQGYGRVRARVQLLGGPSVDLKQFILP